MQGGMSDTATVERDKQNGRFLPGNGGNGGRKPGSRNKLGEEFIQQFAADVAEHGKSVIERVRVEKPEVYLKVWADLLPRKTELSVDIDIMHDVSNVLEAFRVASDLLGTDPRAGLRRLKRIAPTMTIDHEG
jgi:hypothetical protein